MGRWKRGEWMERGRGDGPATLWFPKSEGGEEQYPVRVKPVGGFLLWRARGWWYTGNGISLYLRGCYRDLIWFGLKGSEILFWFEVRDWGLLSR